MVRFFHLARLITWPNFHYTGKTYDLGGQVIAANSAPAISHLAKEVGAEFEEMDSHKLALIDSHTGNYKDLEVADDYVSIMSLTLELQVSLFTCIWHLILSLFLFYFFKKEKGSNLTEIS